MHDYKLLSNYNSQREYGDYEMMFLLGIFGLGALIILVLTFFGSTLLFGHIFIMESKVKRMEREEALNPTPKSDLQILTEAANNMFTEIGNFQNAIDYRSPNQVRKNKI